MSGSNKMPDMLGALRKSADGALKRLSGATETPPPQSFARLDPTRAFMPGDHADEDHEGALPLPALLEESAHAMVRRNEALSGLAGGLARRIEERREGEITMAAQAVRVLIGLVWLAAAVWLYNAILVARADGLSAIPGGAPLADASVLMRTFITVAAAGLGCAFGVAAIARAFGNADNGRVAREAERLGGAIAEAAGEFDRTLTALRSAMDRRGRPADAVDDLSRAHLTALEAHAFFREVGFLTGAEDEHSARLFRGFLARAGGGGSDSGAFAALLSFMSGGVLGALGVYVLLVPKPEVPDAAPQAALAIMQYPWAAQLLIFGGALYAGAGFALSLLSGPLTEGVAAKARAEALVALRSGFAAESAMGPADVTRRIKDAVDVFRARIGGRAAASHGTDARTDFSRTGDAPANQGAGFSTDEAAPEWRRRDSSARFVETGFAAAPPAFRTDAFAKKFSSPERPEPGSKRDGEDLENGSGG